MANPLLDRVLPAELAERSQVIDFKGEIGEFGRLAEVIGADLANGPSGEAPRTWRAAPVVIRLEFGFADAAQRLPAVSGRLAANVATVYQRCLEPFELAVEAPVDVRFVEAGTDETAAGPDAELWELEQGGFRPLELVEELLIMALPLAPTHRSTSECGALAHGIADAEPERVRPFADLKAQMRRKDK